MDYYQAKEFFAFVFNWKFQKKNLILIDKNDVRTWRKLTKLLSSEPTPGCPTHQKIFMKEGILKLFSTSQFIKYFRSVRRQIQHKDNNRKTVSPTSRESRIGFLVSQNSNDSVSDNLRDTNNIRRLSLNESRALDDDQNTNVVKKTCLKVLDDPFYFLTLHVGNLIVLNAFLAIDFLINSEISSE